MSQPAPKLSVAIAFVGLVLGAVAGLAEGLRILRGGTLDVDSGNYRQALAFVDLVNLLLARPRQERLTRGQIHAYGVASIAAGLLGLVGAAYALFVLLH